MFVFLPRSAPATLISSMFHVCTILEDFETPVALTQFLIEEQVCSMENLVKTDVLVQTRVKPLGSRFELVSADLLQSSTIPTKKMCRYGLFNWYKLNWKVLAKSVSREAQLSNGHGLHILGLKPDVSQHHENRMSHQIRFSGIP